MALLPSLPASSLFPVSSPDLHYPSEGRGPRAAGPIPGAPAYSSPGAPTYSRMSDFSAGGLVPPVGKSASVIFRVRARCVTTHGR